MKTIQNTVTKIMDQGKTMKFSDLAIVCVNAPSDSGYSVQDMRDRIRLIDTLEKSEDTINIEDSDFEKLKVLVNARKWGLIHVDIVTFVDIINA